VRGLSPHPAAFSYLEGKILKIYKADIKYDTNPAPPGTWQTNKKSFLQFACADGYLVARELQLEGKKRMNVTDFLRGYRFAE
jgi:methionyl-tRNA formyltransferase